MTITYELYVTGKTLKINKFSYGESSHKGRVNSIFSQLLHATQKFLVSLILLISISKAKEKQLEPKIGSKILDLGQLSSFF